MTERTYDLVTYALVDSLILHSGYSNLRLESFLFTEQAFWDVKRVLRPDGVFVMYNFFRQGWIVERVVAMAEMVFGCRPLVLSLPYAETLRSSERTGFTIVIVTCNPTIADAFRRHVYFALNVVPIENLRVNGFALQSDSMSLEEGRAWQRIGPVTLVHDGGPTLVTSDDWPFLYVRGRLVCRPRSHVNGHAGRPSR